VVMHHLTDLELERYRRRDMLPERLLAANSHLSSCQQCTARYGAENKVVSAFAVLQDLQSINEVESEHLSFERLTDYVDGGLDEKNRTEVKLHIQECAECELRLQELAVLQPLVTTPALPSTEKRSALLERFFAFFRPGLIFQLVSLLLITALLLWAITLKRRVNGLEQAVSDLEKTNEVLAKNQKPASEPADVEVPGDVPDLPESSANLIALNDANGQITLDEKGTLTGFSELLPAYETSIKEALTKSRLQVPRMPSGAGTKDVLMGTAEEEHFALVTPVGKIIQNARPVFRWQALKGATGYQVFLKDATGKIIESGELTIPEWTSPVPLKRGMLYSWQVVARKDGREIIAPPATGTTAQVKILGQAEADEIAQGKKSHPDSHLLLGILYAKAGLLDDARREFTILLKNNPQSDIVKNLLNTVKTRSN
jgi:hypothetical protein